MVSCNAKQRNLKEESFALSIMLTQRRHRNLCWGMPNTNLKKEENPIGLDPKGLRASGGVANKKKRGGKKEQITTDYTRSKLGKGLCTLEGMNL